MCGISPEIHPYIPRSGLRAAKRLKFIIKYDPTGTIPVGLSHWGQNILGNDADPAGLMMLTTAGLTLK